MTSSRLAFPPGRVDLPPATRRRDRHPPVLGFGGATRQTSSVRTWRARRSSARSPAAASRTPTSSRGRPASASGAPRSGWRWRSTARSRPAPAAAPARSAAASRRASTPTCRRFGPSGPGGQIVIDDIRAILALARTRPHEAPARVIVVDDADAMNPNSANGLLKTLEEPLAGQPPGPLHGARPIGCCRRSARARSASASARWAPAALAADRARARPPRGARRDRGRAGRRLGGADAGGGAPPEGGRGRRSRRRSAALRTAGRDPRRRPAVRRRAGAHRRKGGQGGPAPPGGAARRPLPRRDGGGGRRAGAGDAGARRAIRRRSPRWASTAWGAR